MVFSRTNVGVSRLPRSTLRKWLAASGPWLAWAGPIHDAGFSGVRADTVVTNNVLIYIVRWALATEHGITHMGIQGPSA